MQDIFLVLSAIGVEYGVFSYQERFAQLVDTIKSVKKYKPDCYIVLMDVSNTNIPEQDKVFLSNMVQKFTDLSNHFYVKTVIPQLPDNDTNLGARKTIGELIGTLEFLGWLENQDITFKRVYKISGRLTLNEHFLSNNYDDMVNQVATSKKWWYDRYAYLIQLWSFDFNMKTKIFEIFKEIWNFEMDILSNKQRVDIVETTLFRYLTMHKVPVNEIDGYLGVEGYHGQDGAKVYV